MDKLSVDSPATAGSVAGVSPAARPVSLLARAWSLWREFFTFCARHPVWTICMTVFILTWTIELFIVQGYTLVFPNSGGARWAFWAPKIRLALDLLFISTLSIFLRRRWLVVIVIGAFFVYLGLIAYFEYFRKPLSSLIILANWWEGLQVLELDVFPRLPALLLLAALAIKLAALGMSRKASLPRPSARLVGAVLLAGYVSLSSVAIYLDPLYAILTTRGVGRLGHIRGYLGPWFAEWYYLRDDELLQRALDNRDRVYDRITPLEADLSVHEQLVIIQAESLDTNIFGHQVNGVEVTPFLNSLQEKSMFFRVRAIHNNGSSDADFAVLNGVIGSPDKNTYVIPDYPYKGTTPQILADCGFEVYSFHGNSGEFYSRRGAYEKMGFTGLRFLEEFLADYGLTEGRWGIDDEEVLRISAQELHAATAPTCHFVITMTTHTPFTLLHKSEMEIYPNPTSMGERYINNMRYLDNCLREYITSLGGGTTVMIYADHPTQAFDGFTGDHDLDRGLECVPCLIYDSDQDLSKLQTTRDDPRASDGSWNLVDVANYLRGQIKRSHGQAPVEADADKAQTKKPELAEEAAN